MMWSFPWKEYRVQPGEPHTSIWRPLWDSINFCTFHVFFFRTLHIPSHFTSSHVKGDFAVEIWSELSYFGRRITGRRLPPSNTAETDYAQGVTGYSPSDGKSRGGAYALPVARMSYDDDIRLTPYTASHSRGQSASPEDNIIDKDLESPPAVAL